MTTVRQPTKRRRSCVLTLNYTFICVYWWMRQRIHNTLIVVDRYLRLMGDKTIPDSAEPRLESFYPPFVAGIDLPHQGVVDSYNLRSSPPCQAGFIRLQVFFCCSGYVGSAPAIAYGDAMDIPTYPSISKLHMEFPQQGPLINWLTLKMKNINCMKNTNCCACGVYIFAYMYITLMNEISRKKHPP